MGIILFFIIITLIVFFHELGHYFAARLFGVKVLKFAIGFGPTMLSFIDRKGTVWSINMIPLGGYVQLKGFNIVDGNYSDEKNSLLNLHPLKKIIISLAGPLFNFLLAIILSALVIVSVGFFVPASINQGISGVISGSPAQLAGIKKGDKVVSVDNHKLTKFSQLSQYVVKSQGKKVNLTVRRNNNLLKFSLLPQKYDTHYIIGIYPPTKLIISRNPFSAVYKGTIYVSQLIAKTYTGLFRAIISGQIVNNLAGPIMISKLTSQALGNSITTLILFIIIISVNLGVLNLLPLPVLDGGNVVVAFIEFVRNKRFGAKFYSGFYKLGSLLLLLLILFVTIHDIINF